MKYERGKWYRSKGGTVVICTDPEGYYKNCFSGISLDESDFFYLENNDGWEKEHFTEEVTPTFEPSPGSQYKRKLRTDLPKWFDPRYEYECLVRNYENEEWGKDIKDIIIAHDSHSRYVYRGKNNNWRYAKPIPKEAHTITIDGKEITLSDESYEKLKKHFTEEGNERNQV